MTNRGFPYLAAMCYVGNTFGVVLVAHMYVRALGRRTSYRGLTKCEHSKPPPAVKGSPSLVDIEAEF